MCLAPLLLFITSSQRVGVCLRCLIATNGWHLQGRRMHETQEEALNGHGRTIVRLSGTVFIRGVALWTIGRFLLFRIGPWLVPFLLRRFIFSNHASDLTRCDVDYLVKIVLKCPLPLLIGTGTHTHTPRSHTHTHTAHTHTHTHTHTPFSPHCHPCVGDQKG